MWWLCLTKKTLVNLSSPAASCVDNVISSKTSFLSVLLLFWSTVHCGDGCLCIFYSVNLIRGRDFSLWMCKHLSTQSSDAALETAPAKILRINVYGQIRHQISRKIEWIHGVGYLKGTFGFILDSMSVICYQVKVLSKSSPKGWARWTP